MKTQTLFTGQWKQTTKLSIPDPAHPVLCGSQVPAFKKLKDAKRAILNAPTGWGKSLVIVNLVLHKLLKNPKLRCVIAVPQTLIGRGFVQDWKLRVGRKTVEWVAGQNLCDTQATDTVDALVEFLKYSGGQLGDRVLLCTHATLALAYKRLKRTRKLTLLKDTIVWIDEGHHVMNAQVADSQDTVSNAIGALIKYCIAHDNHVGLATATYQRGDLHHILSEAMQESFVRVSIPYDVYFNEIQPVAAFEFNVIAGDTLTALGSIFKTRRPTILYLAKRNSRYAGSCKYKEVKQITKLLRQKDPKCQILDLVTEKGRPERKAFLDGGGQVDVIIALDTCKEGFGRILRGTAEISFKLCDSAEISTRVWSTLTCYKQSIRRPTTLPVFSIC